MSTSNSVLANLNVPDVDFDFDPAATYALAAHWFRHHWMGLATASCVAVATFVVLSALRQYAISYCKRERPGGGGWWLVFGRAAARTTHTFILLMALNVSYRIAHPPSEVGSVIHSLFTIAVVLQCAIWARALILGAFDLRTNNGDYAGEALANAMGVIPLLVSFAVFAIASIVVLDNLGVNVTGLIAGLGIGGIAIGLAAQGIFADLFAALAIILDRPFRRGDTIAYDQTIGTVEAIGLKSTRIRSPTGEERIIANRQLLDKEIQNNTMREYRRYKFALALIYQTPPELARRVPDILREIVRKEGATFVRSGFVNFGASSLDFELEFDGPQPFETGYTLRHAVGLAIAERFAAEGIEFAYPTQTTFTAAPDGTMIIPYAETPAAKGGKSTSGESTTP